MIRLLKDVNGTTVHATDGDIGKVVDSYFGDEKWAVRYLVVDVGSWVPGGHVLISPIAVTRIDWTRGRIDLTIDRSKVRSSPPADLMVPIARRYEREYYRYYGWPFYWGGVGVWGSEAGPANLAAGGFESSSRADETSGERDVRRTVGTHREEQDHHIRSAREVAGYYIKATDQEVGHIDDYLIDENSWVIDSIVIDTSNWPGGKTVVLPRQQIQQINWSTKQ
ncbi:MAG TPA: PRC-barrel domain-containing protein, partial [Acidobacteriota bacterium]|nr:PRC-barrel domain-containing protein [Acidobacteriota bacterium]